ncbi:MAG: site-specific DNA-methyltransferase [candidate division Zixibacteria bacterium]|nr:site-specific DNA-methyltransferase [candidate division Zixibacteria bacterium]
MRSIQELKNQIILGDCVEVLKQIPDESVDVSFADPPFNLGKRYQSYKDRQEAKEYVLWSKRWLYEMVRVTKSTGSIFVHNIPKWLTYFAAYLNEIAYFRHWVSWSAMGAPLGKTLLPVEYGILYYTKRPKGFRFYDIRVPHERCRVCNAFIKDYGGKKHLMHPFGTLASDVWTDIHRIRHNKRRDEHPCQLPVHLLERIILMSSDEEDFILDPFVGTGTTAIAAKKMGRHYIGIDIDEKYVELTKTKIKKVAPIKIGDMYVSVFLRQIVTLRDKDYNKMKDIWVGKPKRDKTPVLFSEHQEQ